MTDQHKPNIILIICDDLAWGDLHCHGNPYTTTSNLDRLHAQSTRLTRYCSGAVCTPARASIMTGRYPYRTRAIDTYCGRSMIDPDEVTLARVLRDAGYATCISGKWHLGDCYPMRAMDLGFDEALVHNGGGLRQYANVGASGYSDPDLMHNGQLTSSKGYCTDIFAEHTCQFIREKRDEPFFIYLATNAPHVPIEIGGEWVKPFANQNVGDKTAGIYGMVENIDHNVGRVLDTLRDCNLDEDTIVIFTSDHGPCNGSREADGSMRYNADLRGYKSTHYDGGIRVPSFWRWPKHFPAADLDMVSNPVDVMPTLAAAAGASLPTDRTIDGQDLLPWLQGEAAKETFPSRTVFMQWHRGNAPQRFRNYAAIGPQYKLTRPTADASDELYDMLTDPGESTNLAGDLPDVVETMRADYERWFDDVSQERGEGHYDPPRIVIGSPHESPTILTRQDWRIEAEDGWSDDDVGHWLVHFDRAGVYDLTIRHPAAAPNGVLRFRCQSNCIDLPLEVGATSMHTTVTCEVGDARVEAWLDRGGKPGGVSYVHFAARVK